LFVFPRPAVGLKNAYNTVKEEKNKGWPLFFNFVAGLWKIYFATVY
jgi:hypothetical protein